MKIALFSDLHLDRWLSMGWGSKDFDTFVKSIGPVDVVINAGDTGSAHANYAIGSCFPEQTYIEAYGNHDYYHGIFENHYYQTEIEGLKWFVGTLWTNFNDNVLARMVATRSINDFNLIQGASVETMTAAFNETVEAIEKYQPHVIVTHFAPTHEAIDYVRHGETVLNYFFCNNLRKFILTKLKNCRLWVYGHSHTAKDYMVGNVRVASNPLGYPRENFKTIRDYKAKIIEIGK